MESSQVTILGARGGVPVSGAEYSRYGGATACVLLETASEALVFDAGTGLLNLPKRVWKQHKRVHLFFSHFHMDHLLGIPMCPMLFDREAEVVLYAPDADKIRGALDQMLQSPLWPVGREVFPAKISYRSLGLEERIENSSMIIRHMPTSHPDGCCAYRAQWEDHSLVYATDCEPDEEGRRSMEEFAKDAQLFILDAQYTRDEYQKYRGYGHSDIDTSADLILGSGARLGMLFHHAPTRTDEQLEQIAEYVKQKGKQIVVAKEGNRVQL